MPEDYAEMTDEELREEYERVIETGVGLGARGMSIGPAVMEGSAIKREMRDRGMEL